jgi:ABC-2 type transport system permease protein
MREIIALAVKDLRLLIRDKAGFFFIFIFPLLIAVFFGTIFSGDGGGGSAISVLIVDQDSSKKSFEFISVLDSAEELKVRRMNNRDEAANLVRRGTNTAFVVIKPGFGESRKNLFWGEPPQIELGVDPARKTEAGMLQGILTKYAVQDMQVMFSDNNAMRQNTHDALDVLQTDDDISTDFKQTLEDFLLQLDTLLGFEAKQPEQLNKEGFSAFEPLKIEKTSITVQRRGPNNSFAVSFPQGIIWGILGTTIGFGVTLVIERTRGTLIRLRIAPIDRWQILAGKGLACFVMTFLISVMLLSIAVAIFGVRPNSYYFLGLAFISTSIAFVGIMMFLSVLGKTEQAASGVSWAVMMVFAMLGGGMIPIFIMPSWMRILSNFSPIKWAMLAMEGAIWREFTLSEMMLPCGILLAVGVVFFFIGSRLFKWFG